MESVNWGQIFWLVLMAGILWWGWDYINSFRR
jgi:hypothetical protein